MRNRHLRGGFTLVELIITAALLLVVFGALMGFVRTSILLLGVSKAETTALSLASDRLEYIRSLTYDNIGTVSGVPAGAIPQNRVVVGNGTSYNERVLIQYIDSAADGIGGSDSNAILSDYKQIKVEYTWTLRGNAHSLYLTSDVMPAGIESTAGGGTIRVNVFDAATAPVVGAAVRFVNTSLVPTIDTTRYTTATGEAYLSGAPAGANYEIYVSKPGYTTDGTYTADTVVVSPSTPPIAVIASQVSTMNFQIDQVATLVLSTKTTPTLGTISDSYVDSSGLTSSSSVTVASGDLTLTNTAGVYSGNGFVVHATASPATFTGWDDATFSVDTPASTAVRLSFYYNVGGVSTLIPDTALPGNSAGFTTSPVDLRSLTGSTYDDLIARLDLSTTDTSVTPAVHELALTYISSQTPIGNVALDSSGQKSLGTDSGGQPVLRYDVSTTTDAGGSRTLSDLIWDAYTLTVTDPAYTVTEQCPTSPLSLYPNTNVAVSFSLTPAVSYALRVTVTDATGTPIPGASVQVDNGAFSDNKTSSLCGQAAFTSGLFSSGSYTVTVSKTGYTTEVIPNVSVTDDRAVQTVILN